MKDKEKIKELIKLANKWIEQKKEGDGPMFYRLGKAGAGKKILEVLEGE
mgnify:CR=1 FL=1